MSVTYKPVDGRMIRLCIIVLVVLLTTTFTFLMVNAQASIQPTQIRDVIWSPSGDRVATSLQNGGIGIYEVTGNNAEMLLEGHAGSVYALAWHPLGNYLASGARNPGNDLRIWNTTNGEMVSWIEEVGTDLLTVGWKPDGSQVIAIAAEMFNEPHSAVVLNFPSGDTRFLSGFGAPIDIAWSPDQTEIALVGRVSIAIINSITFELIATLSVGEQIIRQPYLSFLIKLAWSSDGQYIAGGTGDGRIFIWDVENSEPLFTLIGHEYAGDSLLLAWINALRFDEEQRLTSVAGDGTVRTWNLNDGSMLTEQHVNPHYTADFSPLGAQLALGLSLTDQLTVPRSNTSSRFTEIGLDIVVVDPSIEHLQSIAAECGVPLVDAQLLTRQTLGRLEDTISPGCAADLLAVAEAIQ